jgi:hypothetical protein
MYASIAPTELCGLMPIDTIASLMLFVSFAKLRSPPMLLVRLIAQPGLLGLTESISLIS